jgi:hypothetical protein
MIKFITKELIDFAKWLDKEYPCSQDVTVTEVHSLSEYELNRKGKPNKKCMFKYGLAVYLEGVDEIYIADTQLMKDLLGSEISRFKGYQDYSMIDYLLETFAHEYKHHLQKHSGTNINEEDAEDWCKVVFNKYKNEINHIQ